MWFRLLICAGVLAQATAGLADTPAKCKLNGYKCGDQRVTGTDNRVAPPVIQPVPSHPVQGVCGSTLPPSQAWQASDIHLTCGEGASLYTRTPIAMDRKTDWKWQKLDGLQKREKMQEVRQIDLNWNGTLEYGVYENWSYEQKVGGFNEARCGTEPWETTCARDLEESWIDEKGKCEEYEPEPVKASSETSSGGSGVTADPFGPSTVGSEAGGGAAHERKRNTIPVDNGRPAVLQEKTRKQQEDEFGSFKKREPQQSTRKCIRWSPVTRWRAAGQVTYKCTVQRARFCTWFETRNVSRFCENQTMTYSVQYAKDPKWNPSHPQYIDILPNKWDLLPGETESVTALSNLGVTRTMTPQLVIENAWNKYQTFVAPARLSCKLGARHDVKIEVHTDGRLKRKSPNALAVPADETKPLQFETATRTIKGKTPYVGNGKPYRMNLQDTSRATVLMAAKQSRKYARPEGAPEADPNAKTNVVESKYAEGSVFNQGFWADTNFRLQMFRYDKWGRKVKMNLPLKFSSQNKADVLGDKIEISLTGNEGLENFYRGTGPVEWLLGAVWTRTGVQLTPGTKYTIQVRMLQRGLWFYDSGCENGALTCEGQEADDR
ncbi:MAG TPA: hypothetical protein VFV50_17690, partial [Bdellovibrionales bacterium]|nr:hypothetical protein [Bdellovibrionales bacterium]